MKMNSFFILFVIIWIIIALLIAYLRSKKHKRRISNYLHARGASNITVSEVWFDMDKDTSTYDVQYTNSLGIYCCTSCKIRTNLFDEGDIYWKDTP